MIALRLFTMIFPFLRESILGKATMKDAIRYRPKKVALLGVIMLSFVLNAWLVPNNLSLRRDFKALQEKYQSVDYVFSQNSIFQSQIDFQKRDIERHRAEVERLKKILGCKTPDCSDATAPLPLGPETQIANSQPDKWTDAFKQMQDAEKKRGGR